eukprot:COSAG02_NODE_328_length_24547_cov_4.124141_13_plen_178_part_00
MGMPCVCCYLQGCRRRVVLPGIFVTRHHAPTCKHATCPGAGVPRLAMPSDPRNRCPTSSIARTGSAQVEDSLLPAASKKTPRVFVPQLDFDCQFETSTFRSGGARTPDHASARVHARPRRRPARAAAPRAAAAGWDACASICGPRDCCADAVPRVRRFRDAWHKLAQIRPHCDAEEH